MHFVAYRPMVTTDSVGRFEIRAPRAAEPVNEFETPGGLSLLTGVL
jgi:hypothetical protein